MRLPSMVLLLASSLLIGVQSSPGAAHPGGLNSEGCHNNRRTGDYHCHRAGSSTRSNPTVGITLAGGSFRNCTAARAVGAAPVRRGDPGYGRHLDRDGDGVGCE